MRYPDAYVFGAEDGVPEPREQHFAWFRLTYDQVRVGRYHALNYRLDTTLHEMDYKRSPDAVRQYFTILRRCRNRQ